MMFSPMTIGAPAPSPVEANADELSCKELKVWLQNAIKSCSPVPILLLGNKRDVEGASKLENLSELQTILDSRPGFKIVGHELVSAKDDSQEQLQAFLNPLVQDMKAKAVAGPADDARIQLDAEAAAPSTPSKGCRC